MLGFLANDGVLIVGEAGCCGMLIISLSDGTFCADTVCHGALFELGEDWTSSTACCCSFFLSLWDIFVVEAVACGIFCDAVALAEAML